LLRREKNGNLGRERKKARAMSETGKQKRDRLKAVAAPAWAGTVAAAKASKAWKVRQAYRESQLGKLGAAGPCKRIDPKTGEVIEVITRRGTS
jgi:hypothetical protein